MKHNWYIHGHLLKMFDEKKLFLWTILKTAADCLKTVT